MAARARGLGDGLIEQAVAGITNLALDLFDIDVRANDHAVLGQWTLVRGIHKA